MEENLEKIFECIGKLEFDKTNVGDINESVLKLAFVGDTIFDLFTRSFLLYKYADKIKMNELHKKNSSLVCAKSQARIIEKMINENLLDDDEKDFYRHARNAHPHSKSKNSSIVDYRKATGFEALLGKLFISGKNERLFEVLNNIRYIITDDEIV